jgi:hypothetical protein
MRTFAVAVAPLWVAAFIALASCIAAPVHAPAASIVVALQ